MERLTKNFNREEFACTGKNCCGNSAPIMPVLIDGLQMLRDFIGKPIKILSGFRCRTHNAQVSDANDSYHTKSMAADIAIDGMSGNEIALSIHAAEINCFIEGGIGIYPNRVHVDVRKDGAARWRKE